MSNARTCEKYAQGFPMTIFIFNFPAGEICSEALTLSDTSKFPDSNFKTSSPSNGHEARITNTGWCFGKDNAAYLQIDLTLDYVITQVATFGNKDGEKWMTSYILKYSRDKTKIDSNGETNVCTPRVIKLAFTFDNL